MTGGFLNCRALTTFAVTLALLGGLRGAHADLPNKSSLHQNHQCPILEGDYCSVEEEQISGGTRSTEICITQTFFYTDVGHLLLDIGNGQQLIVDGVPRRYDDGFVVAHCEKGALYVEYQFPNQHLLTITKSNSSGSELEMKSSVTLNNSTARATQSQTIKLKRK